MTDRLKQILSYVLVIAITFAGYEAILAYAFANPSLGLMPADVLRSIYVRELRNTIQIMPECAQYDSYVSYTLRPGRCRFRNLEFDTSYEINSAGLRDDETSLTAPEVVVLGDSFAMGWGVEQHETIPQLIEEETGLRTLNAAVSSFGTAREIRMLERVDLRAAKYLFIQYTENDVDENRALAIDGELQTISPKDRARVISELSQNAEYFLGRYSLAALYYSWHYLSGDKMFSEDTSPDVEREIAGSRLSEEALFVNAIRSAKVDLSDLVVIVFELSSHNQNDSEFVDKLRDFLAVHSDDIGYVREIRVLDVSPVLSDDHYFVLDDHINRDGHRVVAEALLESIHR